MFHLSQDNHLQKQFSKLYNKFQYTSMLPGLKSVGHAGMSTSHDGSPFPINLTL